MTDDGRERTRAWWDDVDDGVEAAVARDAELPDPWRDAGDDPGDLALTADQEAFLAGLDDQPPVPRLTGLELGEDPGATGSLPGDIEATDS